MATSLRDLIEGKTGQAIAEKIEGWFRPDYDACAKQAAHAQSISEDESKKRAAAVQAFALKNGRDSLLVNLLPPPFSLFLVFVFDLRQTEKHLANARGTLVLLDSPELTKNDFHAEVLKLSAGKHGTDDERLYRAGHMLLNSLRRNGTQSLATYVVRGLLRPLGPLGYLPRVLFSGAWGYSEIVVESQGWDALQEHFEDAKTRFQTRFQTRV